MRSVAVVVVAFLGSRGIEAAPRDGQRRYRGDPLGTDKPSEYARERAGKTRSPAEQRAHRLEKYDRLLEMAEKAKADVPELRAEVASLKAREEAIMGKDDELRPPRPPRLGFGGEDPDLDEEEDMFGANLKELLHGGEGPSSRRSSGRFVQGDAKLDAAKREEYMKKSRDRLERMRNMDPEERIAEMRRERDERLAERAALKEKGILPEDGAGDDPLLSERSDVRAWRSKTGDYGPPKPRGSGLENLTPEERHQKLLDHQKLMEDHRQKMDEWREQHEAYMSERRAIMDSYRDLSHQIREAVFANRPL